MPTFTTNYQLSKPLVNNATDQDLWGGELNDDMDSIDTLLRAGITVFTQAVQTTAFVASASINVKNLYPCDATGGAFAATIPAAATAGEGATLFIRKDDASTNAITLARTGSDTLDGVTSLSLALQNDCYGLVSDGVSAWRSICKPAGVQDATTSVKGIVQLATAAEVLAGIISTKVPSPAALAGNISLGSSGYYKLPGGLILQWGTTGSINALSAANTSFPTPFATACYSVVVVPTSNHSGGGAVGTVSTTQFNTFNGTSATVSFYFFAVGK